MKREEVIYRGILFYRYPESKRRDLRVYYRPSGTFKTKGIFYLHREIWQDAHGEIPKGYVIHHKNNDPSDNRLENLECIKKSDHMRHHWEHDVKCKPDTMAKIHAALARGRPGAIAWHKSKAAIPTKRRAGKKSWENREYYSYKCQCCKKEYQSKMTTSNLKYCSRACLSEARRRSGVDNEKRLCLICNSEFTCNKYFKKKTCGRKCGSILMRSKRE